MSDFRVTESDGGRELVMGGSLTIENASSLRLKLLEALMREDDLSVCIDTDAVLDVSFLQILCSAHRTATKLDKTFLLRDLAEDNFASVVKSAGYSRKRGCARDKYDTCLWLGGSCE